MMEQYQRATAVSVHLLYTGVWEPAVRVTLVGSEPTVDFNSDFWLPIYGKIISNKYTCNLINRLFIISI